jgi:hypothetical protein
LKLCAFRKKLCIACVIVTAGAGPTQEIGTLASKFLIGCDNTIDLAHSVRDPPANKGELLSHEASDCYKCGVILDRRKLANPLMHKRIQTGLK